MTQINPEEIPPVGEEPIAVPAPTANGEVQGTMPSDLPVEAVASDPVAAVAEPLDATVVTDQVAAPTQAVDAVAATDEMPLLQVIEALLFSSDAPLSLGKLAETVGLDSTKPVKAAVDELNRSYEERHAAFRIEERAGGLQLLTLPQYGEYIQRLVRKKDEGRLTPAALETLAIISYKQPILRVDVEAIRGVACGEVIRTLMEHNLVKIVGRAELVGRPMLYGTTRYFLEVFGLANIRDLPKAEMLKEPK